jgi:hypothetical protein
VRVDDNDKNENKMRKDQETKEVGKAERESDREKRRRPSNHMYGRCEDDRCMKKDRGEH